MNSKHSCSGLICISSRSKSCRLLDVCDCSVTIGPIGPQFLSSRRRRILCVGESLFFRCSFSQIWRVSPTRSPLRRSMSCSFNTTSMNFTSLLSLNRLIARDQSPVIGWVINPTIVLSLSKCHSDIGQRTWRRHRFQSWVVSTHCSYLHVEPWMGFLQVFLPCPPKGGL